MRTLAVVALALLASAPPAEAAGSRAATYKSAVKADARSRGLKDLSDVIVTGDSFTILSRTDAPKPIERVMATGTIDRKTGKVTSFNPILME